MSKIPPDPQSPKSPEFRIPNTKGEPAYHRGQMENKPLSFLGMLFTGEQAKILWQSIIQAIGTQIDKEKKKAIKALRKNFGSDQDD